MVIVTLLAIKNQVSCNIWSNVVLNTAIKQQYLIYIHKDLQITARGRIINAEVSLEKHPWLVYTRTTLSERSGENTYKEHNTGCPGAIISYSRYILYVNGTI